jgi:hypothetical protein
MKGPASFLRRVHPSSAVFLLEVALPFPQLTPHPLGQLLLYAAVVLNLPAYFHDLFSRYIEGAAPALLLPIQVVQRPVLLAPLATATRLAADDIRGPILPEPVQIIVTIPMGASVKLIGKGLNTGQRRDSSTASRLKA